MAVDEMDRPSADYVGLLLIAGFTVFTVALFAILIAFMILVFQARCRNTSSFLTMSAVGLTIQIILTIGLFKGITGCSVNPDDSFVSFSFLFNYYQHLSTGKSSEYVSCCADFRTCAIFLSVINLVALLNQAMLNNLPKKIQTAVRCVTISYFAVITGAVIWIYRTSGRDLILTAAFGTLPTCPHAARAHILPVLMETLFIYGPALTALLKTLNSHKGQPDEKLECMVFKDCWSDDGVQCSVCLGSNRLLKDACMFYAFIMLIFRPAIYICFSTFNGYITEIYVCGCNLLIPVVLAINAIPYLNRIFVKSMHAVDSDIKTELNIIKI
ncbi:uncharacterized protein LOC110445583 [Mizuhopecten yessoensis]|uniref:uncharacterized protein LOC110445583 n=1 Tax=Mizuhopecten yessoensis TaxID=6573 RepID=UPI000B4580E4|nr:uncharacterized protein LOC110445583 [Mizuhopecten yessoensis]